MKWFMAPLGLLFCLMSGGAFAQSGNSGQMRAVTSYVLSVAPASVQISGSSLDDGVGNGIFAIRLVADVAAHVAIGVSPQTATIGHLFLPANVPGEFAVRPGEYIAVIRVSSNGLLYITELSR